MQTKPDQTTLNQLFKECRDDPVRFSEELLGMKLHPGQKRYMEAAKKGVKTPQQSPEFRIFVLSAANRYGKSVVISCLQLWYLFYKIGIPAEDPTKWAEIEYRTANIAPISPLTEPVFRTMKNILTNRYPVPDKDGKMTTNVCLIDWFYDEKRTINTPPYKMYFQFNCYIEHLSLMGGKGNNLQGKPYGLITYDEACRSDHLQLEMDNSILGRLLDWTAPLHLLSTPDSDSASLIYYHRLYQNGLLHIDQTHTQEGSIYENSFMTKTQIQDQVKMLEGNPLKDQMLEGKFVWGGNNLFKGEAINDCLDRELNNGERYQDKHKYVIGIDTAIGSDEMVYTVLDTTAKPYRIVREIAAKGNSKSPQLHLNDLLMLIDEYNHSNNVELCLETWSGESIRFFYDLPDHIKGITTCYGAWSPSTIDKSRQDNPTTNIPNASKKSDLLINLNKIITRHEIRIPSNAMSLIQQLTIYKEKDNNLATDHVFALAMACWLAEDRQKQVVTEWVSAEW